MAPWSKKMKSFIRVEEKIYEQEKNLINSNHMLVPTTQLGFHCSALNIRSSAF
jgi:hypothetical protein